MKLFSKILSVLVIVGFSILSVQAGFLSDFISSGRPNIPYCNTDDCGVKEGVKATEGINSVVTNQKASEYIQNITQYILGFVAILAVLYIIYAGFNILTGNGDEEKIKKSKSIITYVILGIIIMFLAYSIVTFIFGVLDSGTTPDINTVGFLLQKYL